MKKEKFRHPRKVSDIKTLIADCFGCTNIMNFKEKWLKKTVGFVENYGLKSFKKSQILNHL